MRDVLAGFADRRAVEILAEAAADQRRSAIDQTDAIDRKLIAVLTASGAYLAIIVGLGPRITNVLITAVVIVGLSVLTVLLGLRPQRYPAADIGALHRDLLAFDPVDVHRILLADLVRMIAISRTLNRCKSRLFNRSLALTGAGFVMTVAAILTSRGG